MVHRGLPHPGTESEAMLTKLVKLLDDGGEVGSMASFNIYEAKTSLSKLVEQAVAGEEVIIAKAGKPMVRMVPFEAERKSGSIKRDWGKNLLGVTYIAPDFDEPAWTDEELDEFGF